MKKWREKLPNYEGRKIYYILVRAILIFILGLFTEIFFEILPRLFPTLNILMAIEPYLPVIIPLMMGVIGLSLVRIIWNTKDKFLRQNKNTAYQRGLRIFMFALPLLFSIVVHTYIQGCYFLLIPPANPLTQLLSISLFSFLPYGLFTIGFWIQIVLALIFLIFGLLIIIRSLKTFGIDYMTLVYLYYPEESQIQNHKIYSILRHPTYAGLMCVMLGGAFFSFSVYSILQSFIIFFGLSLHIRLVEEPELIKRFGDSYIEYRKNVPVIFVKIKDLPKLIKFIIGK